MTSTTALQSLRFDLDVQGADAVLEFVAFLFPPEGAFVVGWPAAPGAVRHDPAGRPVLLHFAPARWLVPAPSADVSALVEAAVESKSGTVVDATGKWHEFRLSGPDAARALGLSIDSESVLDGRECASVVIFDCPCVLARLGRGYAIWVRASFAVDFEAAFARLRAPARDR
jgi:heterotetrameric sarcosine oxidase gamma subunit